MLIASVCCGVGRNRRIKRKLMIIGIGAGNPDHVTIQAVEAMALAKASAVFGAPKPQAAIRESR
jgi:precorrin-2 methylase